MKKPLVMLLIASILAIGSSQLVSAACLKIAEVLVWKGCNPDNWCWWQPNGQMEYIYEVYWDCDGDGYIDQISYRTAEGDCCW